MMMIYQAVPTLRFTATSGRFLFVTQRRLRPSRSLISMLCSTTTITPVVHCVVTKIYVCPPVFFIYEQGRKGKRGRDLHHCLGFIWLVDLWVRPQKRLSRPRVWEHWQQSQIPLCNMPSSFWACREDVCRSSLRELWLALGDGLLQSYKLWLTCPLRQVAKKCVKKGAFVVIKADFFFTDWMRDSVITLTIHEKNEMKMILLSMRVLLHCKYTCLIPGSWEQHAMVLSCLDPSSSWFKNLHHDFSFDDEKTFSF